MRQVCGENDVFVLNICVVVETASLRGYSTCCKVFATMSIDIRYDGGVL